MKDILYYQDFSYILEIIYFKIISYYYNNLLTSHFKINKKTYELVVKKYFWPTFYQNIEAYIKEYNIYLASKAIYYKLYNNP